MIALPVALLVFGLMIGKRNLDSVRVTDPFESLGIPLGMIASGLLMFMIMIV